MDNYSGVEGRKDNGKLPPLNKNQLGRSFKSSTEDKFFIVEHTKANGGKTQRRNTSTGTTRRKTVNNKSKVVAKSLQ